MSKLVKTEFQIGENKRQCDSFAAEEDEVIIRLYYEKSKVLQDKFSGTNVTNQAKRQALLEVTEAVNALGHRKRSAENVKIKNKNMIKLHKEYYMEKKHPPTGGGKAKVYQPFMKEIDYYYPNSARVHGVDGGVEVGNGDEVQVSVTNIGDETMDVDVVTDRTGITNNTVESVDGDVEIMRTVGISHLKAATFDTPSPGKMEKKPKLERNHSGSSKSLLEMKSNKTKEVSITTKYDLQIEILSAERDRAKQQLDNATMKAELFQIQMENESRRAKLLEMEIAYHQEKYRLILQNNVLPVPAQVPTGSILTILTYNVQAQYNGSYVGAQACSSGAYSAPYYAPSGTQPPYG